MASQNAFNPNPRTITWERLEAQRLKRLGLSNKYSRHFNVLRQSRESPAMSLELSGSATSDINQARMEASGSGRLNGPLAMEGGFNKKVNSVAPFATVGKPTCGYFFSDKTDNRKIKFGIPPSDLVKWRNFSSN